MPQPINIVNNNTPEAYDKKFNGTLGVHDMERHYKLSKYFKSGTYVDVGCFDSIMPILLAERSDKNKIYAIDHSPKLIAFLKERFPKVNYIVADAYTLPFEDNSVDYVCAGETIEHLSEPKKFVDEVMRVLKPNGWFSLSTPFEEDGRSVGGIYHLWRWTVNDIEKLLETNEIEILKEENSKVILAWKQKK